MKDLSPRQGIRWPSVFRTRLAGSRPGEWLALDDLIFVPRGTRFYATPVDEPPGPAVCGPHLFHMRLKPGYELLAGFLAWQINQRPFQRELQRAAEGSSQLSVRRPVLQSLPIGIPDREDQQRIVDLVRLADREEQLHARLARNRERQFEAIADALHAPPGSAADLRALVQ